jgi:hypothetical protein
VTAAIEEEALVEDSRRVGAKHLAVEFEALDRTRCGLSFEKPNEMAERPLHGLGRKANVDEDVTPIPNNVDLELG